MHRNETNETRRKKEERTLKVSEQENLSHHQSINAG